MRRKRHRRVHFTGPVVRWALIIGTDAFGPQTRHHATGGPHCLSSSTNRSDCAERSFEPEKVPFVCFPWPHAKVIQNFIPVTYVRLIAENQHHAAASSSTSRTCSLRRTDNALARESGQSSILSIRVITLFLEGLQLRRRMNSAAAMAEPQSIAWMLLIHTINFTNRSL